MYIPNSVREENQKQGDKMVQDHDREVLSYRVKEDGSIQQVVVQADLHDVQPVDVWVNSQAWMPI